MSRRENPFQAEREAYQQIEIPDELQYVVKKSIKKAEKLRLEKRKRLIIRSIASVAALFFLTLTIGVNSSYAVSKKVSKMPVVRSVAKVLTVRKYTAEKAAGAAAGTGRSPGEFRNSGRWTYDRSDSGGNSGSAAGTAGGRRCT